MSNLCISLVPAQNKFIVRGRKLKSQGLICTGLSQVFGAGPSHTSTQANISLQLEKSKLETDCFLYCGFRVFIGTLVPMKRTLNQQFI